MRGACCGCGSTGPPAWFYEKRRHTWRYGECEIAVDDVPELGGFVEVEGPSEERIAQTLSALGLDPSAHLAESYLALFAAHCAARGIPFCDMRFEEPLAE